MKLNNHSINRVLIVGGTHGNELTGVYLVKLFQQHPELIHRATFESLTLLANPQAIKAGRRYIDKDLNRSFLEENLEDGTLVNYEDLLAKNINHIYGQNGKYPVDFIVDLHSTTSNMGVTVLLDDDQKFNLQLAAYLSSLHPEIKIYSSGSSGRGKHGLRSRAKFAIGIEVGAIPQGVVNADLFLKTQTIVYATLDYLELYNQNKLPTFSQSFTLYKYLEKIDYPRNEHGEITAMIHPHIQYKDYQALNPSDPMFLTFDGQTITYAGESPAYPIFLNEAAYYEQSTAMCLTQKHQMTI
ncbi:MULTISPECIES: aspartoacylase [Calothrix]|uniref:Probable aspartoacylase n=2 Tax=Calothrix TaxID=1186 RepID=A0ABR8AJV1_9CYAN|nr:MULTISPECIES: aspartoacylase [Calothrix]MBD2200330.1 aspartoacylase [Calothrix parietina FACHB-288]MBD2228954.1 aspartoacylase [Calothrix anomala FACHB-343]